MSQPVGNAIGTRIHLISSSDIRYDGLLHEINADDNTVSLKNVRIFGTEGRKNGVDEVPSSDQLFELIVFRGSDIKDLTLYEDENGPKAAKGMDPAIIQATPATKTFATAARANTGFYDEGRRGGHHGGAAQQQRFGQGNQQRYNRRGGYGGGYGGGAGGGAGGGGGRGAGGYRRRHTDGHTGQEFTAATGQQREEFKEEFDFDKSREAFEKAKTDFEQAREEARTQGSAYTKTSFFDTISCDQKSQQNRVNRDDMKRADTETFGTEMVGSMRVYGRRGRGGRGRFNRH